MPIGVVDLFEMIDIHKDEAKGLAAALKAAKFARQIILHT